MGSTPTIYTGKFSYEEICAVFLNLARGEATQAAVAKFLNTNQPAISNYVGRMGFTRQTAAQDIFDRIHADMIRHRALEPGHPRVVDPDALEPPNPAPEPPPLQPAPTGTREEINAAALAALQSNLRSLIAMSKGSLPPKMRLDATKMIMDIYKATSVKADVGNDAPDSWSEILRSLDRDEEKIA